MAVLAESNEQEKRYYVAIFRIFRRIGYDAKDAMTVLMQNMSLDTDLDLDAWSALLKSAREKVESDSSLPAGSKAGTSNTGFKN